MSEMGSGRRQQWSWRTAGAAVVLVAAGVAAGCGSAGPADEMEAGAGTGVSEVVFSAAEVENGVVRWAPADTAHLANIIEVPGQLIPNEDRTVRLGAPARGRVTAVHVALGQRVRRGDPLVTLWSADASAALADYRKAVAEHEARKTAAEHARIARERAERLLEIKAASRQEAERARVEDEAARAALAQAGAELERARTAMEQLGVDTTSGAMVLRSPLSGVVLSRDAVPGTVAEPGTPLVVVADPATLWLDASVPDRAAAELELGASVRFAVPSFPADTFEARIESIGGALDPETRMLPLRAVVDNASGRLRPEMFATVWVEAGRRREAVVVPENAVQELSGRPVVFIAEPDERGGARFRPREVEVGTPINGRTPIFGGVEPGEIVVVEGAFAVKAEFARAQLAEG